MNKLAMAVATASLLLSTNSQAATVIQDTFWGAGIDGVYNDKDHQNFNIPGLSGDVYDPSRTDPSEKSKYDIDSAEATLTQNLLTVVIKSSLYFSSYLKPKDDPDRVSDAPGDLYLSTTGWSPAGSAGNNYGTDDSINGTAWNYAISLSDVYLNDVTFGTATLYKTFDGTTSYGTSRLAQEAWSDFTGAASYGTGKWRYIKEATGEMSLLIEMNLNELLGDDWDGKSALGFHFTMDCGNDVIEGSIAPVPLPSACLLLGSALVGLMGVARRRIR